MEPPGNSQSLPSANTKLSKTRLPGSNVRIEQLNTRTSRGRSRSKQPRVAPNPKDGGSLSAAAGPSTSQPPDGKGQQGGYQNRIRTSSKGPSREPKPAMRSWAAITRTDEKGYNLSYVPPSTINGKPLVEISDAILEDANPKWRECLVGYYVGKKLPFKLTEELVKKMWGPYVVDVMANDEGFFFFHIPDDSFRRRIIDGGPITLLRVPMILQQWHPGLELKQGQHEALPVWVRLRSIPYALWSASGISAVASAIGKPLYVDLQTEQMKRISFARVCIEIKASQPLADSVDVMLNGTLRPIKVEYEWRPKACETCGIFGHKCEPTRNVSTVIPKAPSTVSAVVAPQQSEEGWVNVQTKKGNLKHKDPPPSIPIQTDMVASLLTSNLEETSILNHNDLDRSLQATPVASSDSESDNEVASEIGSDEDVPLPSIDPPLLRGRALPAPKKDHSPMVREPSPSVQQHAAAQTIPAPESSPSTEKKAIPKSSKKRVGKKKRGLVDPLKQAEIRSFVRSNNISCLGITETKVNISLFDDISSGLLPGWKWTSNYESSPRGRIWVGWDTRFIELMVIASSDQVIHGNLRLLPINKSCIFSVVYGEHSFGSRRALWADLIQSSASFSNVPWLVAGDFNAIRTHSDRVGSSNAWIPAFNEFGDCLDQAGLDDLRYVGHRFTWSTSSGELRKQRKIDRALVNEHWSSIFSFSEASFLAPGVSDHTPILIRLMTPPNSKKPFKFFNFWLTHPAFLTITAQAWEA
ncbi:uncharacterized protein LOC115666717 [Syzygium oleosum]|uniref:uncharacterized protein LOC115666717 n=1 Tax=Syzygium oleosum TaxID=219896 RepID=UPI0011D18766|nr:uncharacterized protein LOC115666717 [Syzygium oleosum]